MYTSWCCPFPHMIQENFKKNFVCNDFSARFPKVREAAQALLKTELSRMGVEGRSKLVESWTPHLPSHMEPLPTGPSHYNNHQEPPHTPRQEQQSNKVSFLSFFLFSVFFSPFFQWLLVIFLNILCHKGLGNAN